jgi:Glycosyltransferase like family 2
MEPLSESPGTIALPTSEVGRFVLFTVSLCGTQQPPNTYLSAMCSASVTENLNQIFRQIRPEDRWVWIMGDDHVWPNDTLMRMLQTMDEYPEIDVLVPLCVKRNPPWSLVLFDELEAFDADGTPLFDPIPWERVPESGVFEVDAAGSAGMLLRRHVIDEIEDPWWFSTMDWKGRQVVLNEDVTFCTRIRRHHGFRIFATADVVLGHLGLFNVRPMFHEGRWGALTEFTTMDERFRHMFMPVAEKEPVGV